MPFFGIFCLRPSHRKTVIFGAYLDPNSHSMQKPIEGVYHFALLLGLFIVPSCKGAVVFA